MSTASRLINVDGPRLRHSPAFDGFRGVAVLLVVFYHAEVAWFLGGTVIVIDWFFVASGFLITTLILDERHRTGSNNMRRFYERRVLRLFPAMYAMLAVFSAMMLIVTAVSAEARSELGNWWVDALGAATYSYYLVAAIIPNKVTGAIGHTWSLSLEEQFYFIWPILMVFTLSKARKVADRTLITGAVLFIITMFALRVGLQHLAIVRPPGTAVGTVQFTDIDNPTWQGAMYRIASVRPDMIIYGCLLAVVQKSIPDPLTPAWDRRIKVWGKVGLVAFFAVVAFGNRFRGFTLFGRPIFDLFGGPGYQVALLLLAPFTLDLYRRPHGLFTRLLTVRPLRWLGVRSYGIYLWHVPALLVVYPALQNVYGLRHLAIGIVGGLLGIGAGVLSFRYIEQPFLRLKETKYQRPQDLADASKDLTA